MAIDTAAFSPLPALAGGALIGLAAGWYALARGRIAGISGLVGQLVPVRGDVATAYTARVAPTALFLAGLILAPVLFRLAGWQGAPRVAGSTGVLLAAGLLVGYGTRLGGGCTSGHGVCGISRLSVRSIVATGLFMGSAILTVWLQKQFA